MSFLLTMICVGAIFIVYALFEKRSNQRQCPACGFKMSVDSVHKCPKCAGDNSAVQLPPVRRTNWAKIVLIAIPITIAAVNGAIIIAEESQPETGKAIRIVQESASRKENFTVQQYLYATLYYRRDNREPIEINGWSAQQSGGAGSPISVEFRFNEQGIEQIASWEVDLASKKVLPKNDIAKELSRN